MASPLRSFLRAETAGALAMLAATVAALVWVNSPWGHAYESFWRTMLSIRIGPYGISQDLRHWVNDGLMTLFFLVVGLEARRELEVGQLREPWTVAVPLVAALGGMAAARGDLPRLQCGRIRGTRLGRRHVDRHSLLARRARPGGARWNSACACGCSRCRWSTTWSRSS